MEITILGSASAYPTPKRGVSSTALKFPDGKVWLFDCGEGTQVQLQKSNLKPGKIERIFITHLHGDHLFGLPGLLCTLGMQSHTEPLHIYGPEGLRKFVRHTLTLSYTRLPYKYAVHELALASVQRPWDEAKQSMELGDDSSPAHADEIIGENVKHVEAGLTTKWQLFSNARAEVQASWLQHKVPCFGFVIQEASTPGRLDVEYLTSLGIKPGPIYGEIKGGKDVTTSDGKTVRSCDVVMPEIRGRKVVILGDTMNSDAMAEIARDCDVLVHECTFHNGLEENAHTQGHSTPKMLAGFANLIRARRVILTHFSQRYGSDEKDGGREKGENDVTLETLQMEVEKSLEYGPVDVFIGNDFTTVDIPRPISR